MYEAGDFQCLIPEDEYENHLTLLNKSSLQLHRLSLQRSNLTSQILQEDVWESNARLFNEDAMDSIIASANAILQNTGPGNTDSWECEISKYDPNGHITFDLVDRSLNPCELCNSKQNIESKTLEKFFNNECKCQLNLNETRKNKVKENKRGQIEPDLVGNPEVWSLDSPETSQDYTGDKYFKAKFGRQKTKSSYKPLSKEPKSEKPSVSEEKPPYNSYKEEETWVKKSKNQKKNEEIDFEKIEEENKAHKSNVAKITFRTAKEQLLATNPAAKRSLGATRKAQSKFVSPMIGAQDNKQESSDSGALDDRLKHIDPKMVELIESEIIDKGTPIGWDDIAGLTLAKSTIQEAVVWPLLRPDMFTGLRRPPKGILLFGPPGTGKTLIGKCVAAQCHATFFSISASSLTSKWIGDGEKMVRALFAVARCYQPAVSIEPSVIFIDEIDSLLTARSDSEHEATRRIKTEFLVQFDGANTADDDRLLVVGATNRPQELDEAARRRLVKRLYIPLPDLQARQQIITNLLQTENNNLSPSDIMDVSRLTDGYSGADMKSLCSEAAMGPIRAVPFEQIATIQRDKVRPVNAQDFVNALQRVRPSVSQDDLGQYEKWNNTYGQGF